MINIFCGCHCSVALLNCVDLSVSFTRWVRHGLIHFFMCTASFLFLFTVNDLVVTVVFCLCTKLTHVLRAIKYYINSFREFGNDNACSKLAVLTGCPLECLLTNDVKMTWKIILKCLSHCCQPVLTAVVALFICLCWLNGENLIDLTHRQPLKVWLCCWHLRLVYLRWVFLLFIL